MTKPLSDFQIRFAQAQAKMAQRLLHLNDIAAEFNAKFKDCSPLYHFEILPGRDGQFGAVIFYRTDNDIEVCEANGTSEAMREFIHARLEAHGKGARPNIDVQFEFDSDENVQRNFGGNYFLRMR